MTQAGEELRRWLHNNGVTQRDAADHIGVWIGSLVKVMKGSVVPSLRTAFKIEEMTRGAITAKRFYMESEILSNNRRKDTWS